MDASSNSEATRASEPAFSLSQGPMRLLSQGPVLLYDGECGVCSASIQWILRHERQSDLRFAPLTSELGRMLRESSRVSQTIDSLLWVEQHDGHVRTLIWSDALLAVLNYVAGPWKILTVMRVIPAPLRHAAYRLFARHRRKFAPVSCLLPPPEVRQRFISAS